MTRIGFALGTWQIVTLAAGLRQQAREARGERHDDYLVLYEPAGATDALKSAMQALAEAVWAWKRIVWAFDLLSVRRRLSQPVFDALQEQVRERIGIAEADELWFCWLTRPTEKLILEAYPTARAVLYEDGLTSYLPVSVAPSDAEREARAFPLGLLARGTRIRDERRPVRRFRRYKGRLDPRHRDRLSAAYLILSDTLPVPEAFAQASCHTIETRLIQETLDACLPLTEAVSLPSGGAARVLVLGQSLYQWRVLTREQECTLYRRVVDTLLGRGYDILWKEHPRVREPFFPALRAAGGSERLRELDLPFALPVEMAAGRLGLTACVAGLSAALFYLPRLNALPTYTFADEMTPFLTRQWAVQNAMVRGAIPALAALPAARSARVG